MGNDAISEATRNNLDKETFLYIQVLSNTADDIHNLLNLIKGIELLIPSQNPTQDTSENSSDLFKLKRILEYGLLINLIGLDLACAIRFYLIANLKYEVIYSAKQLIVTLNEGFKIIYHYVNLNSRKDPLTNRNNSFWVRDIGELVKESNIISLQADYERITNELDIFCDNEFEKLKQKRDYAVHYDYDAPSEVYRMLTSLEIENICLVVRAFLPIIKDMTDFCKSIFDHYYENIRHSNENSFTLLLQKIESLQKEIPENTQTINKIENIKKILIQFKNLQ